MAVSLFLIIVSHKNIDIDYEWKPSAPADRASKHHFLTASSFELFPELDGQIQESAPLSKFDFGGWTLPRSANQKVQRFHIVVPDSTKAYRLVVSAKNIASGKMERSKYRIVGGASSWIPDGSNFKIHNMGVEVYHPSSASINYQKHIRANVQRLCCSDQVKNQSAVFSSLWYACDSNKIGSILERSYNGKLVELHGWSPVYVDEHRCAYAYRRLSTAESEVCKERMV
ncbi:hypothetical protein RF11_14742 [Thelohanellus kitauei]|uniref:Uncharacterized protein n=1 Tax=Thelohanellus kitauei TaxID=669202 RepID=A0A0C2MPN2_THEKT|nr:hypothetical protein RF11_14742 [Thelohanellus kitauei]